MCVTSTSTKFSTIGSQKFLACLMVGLSGWMWPHPIWKHII